MFPWFFPTTTTLSHNFSQVSKYQTEIETVTELFNGFKSGAAGHERFSEL